MRHPLLKLQIEEGKYSHAYLLEGKNDEITRVEGLELAEKIFSKNGEGHLIKEKFHHGSLGDFLEVTPKKKKISIEEIREVIRFFSTSPLEAPYKIAFLPNSHKMGNEAANALLKTLEEPAAYGILILTTISKRMLLPTVVSRCRIFSYLEEKEQKKALMEVNEILFDVLKGNMLAIPSGKEVFDSFKEEKEELLNYIEGFLGDLFLFQKGISEKIIFSENYGYYDKLSKTKNLDKMILKAEEVRKNFRVNANYQLSLEELFIYMMEVAHG